MAKLDRPERPDKQDKQDRRAANSAQPSQLSRVRVRLRPGAQFKVPEVSPAGWRVARGGEWIELDPRDLSLDYIRALVETEDDIENAPAEAVAKSVAANAESVRQFEEARSSAMAHNQASANARQQDEKRLARELLIRHPELAEDAPPEPEPKG